MWVHIGGGYSLQPSRAHQYHPIFAHPHNSLLVGPHTPPGCRGHRRCRSALAPWSVGCRATNRVTKASTRIQDRIEVERYVIHDATASDYEKIAEVHCKSFYGDQGPFWDTVLRMDRVLALHQGETASPPSFSCMTAVDMLNAPSEMPSVDSSAVVEKVLTWMMGAPNMEGNQKYSTRLASDKNIVGAVVVDTHMAFIPPRFTWPAFFNSQLLNLSPRPKTAYISNLAVCSSLRRSGIGTKLIKAAEARALEWGCSWIALHVDPANTAAYALYKRLGYRSVSRQTPWQAFLEGRKQPLELMVNSLPAS